MHFFGLGGTGVARACPVTPGMATKTVPPRRSTRAKVARVPRKNSHARVRSASVPLNFIMRPASSASSPRPLPVLPGRLRGCRRHRPHRRGTVRSLG
eukprot:gene9751-biopygen1707